MAEDTTDRAMRLAVGHHRAGRLAEAERIFRQVLAKQPDHAGALHLLGVLAGQGGRLDAAVELIRRAVRFNPDYAVAHNDLGIALQSKGQLDEAIASYRQAIRIKPDYADAHSNLGIVLMHKGQPDEAIASYRLAIRLKPDGADVHSNLGFALMNKGQLEEAIAAYRQAIRLKPDLAEAHVGLGNALEEVGQLDEAIASYRQAIRLKPDYTEAHNNLGIALGAKGELDEAIASCRYAIRLKPDLAEAHNNLGNALKDMGQFDEAIASYRQAIQIKPDYAEAHSNLGIVLMYKGQLDEAIAAYRQAIWLKPDYTEAHNNLAGALKDMGQLDEAIACFRQAIRLKPGYASAHSNLLYALHFHPGYDARMIYEEHRRWSDQFAEPLKKFIEPHGNSRDPDRPLRIGYVSPDFRDHPVGRFMVSLLAAHDPDRFEIFCYSDVRRADRFTGLLRGHARQWRNTVGLTDQRMAQLVREDQIDVLVDLTMHMARNRLLLFARKPAPVQVTYLAYCSTTGLETMDYRLSDPHLDPPGMNDEYYSEETIRLPETYWCYPMHEQSPQVGPPPALGSGGEVTFGCLNNFCKASPEALDLWIQLLRGLPKSRLILQAGEGSHRQRVRDLLERQGMDAGRVKFVGWVPLPEYFKRYEQIDVGLDPFPCNGGTTTCDALWMGVPVVTLAGRTAVGRGGVSVLRNVGMPELIAETPQQYVQIATDLAGDLPRLGELRRTLRARMQASPLMDAERFARNIEAAYRQMWRNWCERGGVLGLQCQAP